MLIININILQNVTEKMFSTYISIISTIRQDLAVYVDELEKRMLNLEKDLAKYIQDNEMNEKFYM